MTADRYLPTDRYVPTSEDRFAPDADELGRQGMAFERLDQLALEHLYGVR